jgi:L-rhamnose mutarotase
MTVGHLQHTLDGHGGIGSLRRRQSPFMAIRTGRQAMETIAFRMKLNQGQADAYKQRHDAIWPELAALLKDAGASDYSIWLDEETHHLFAILKRPETHGMDALPKNEVVRRWWDYMADIMAVEPDNTPVQVPLVRMFHLA